MDFMLWYGKNTLANFRQVYKRRSQRCNLFIRTLAFPVPRHGTLARTNMALYIPSGWNFVMLKSKSDEKSNKIIYLFSDIYYFKVIVYKVYLNWYFDHSASCIALNNWVISNYYRTYFTQITNIFASFSKKFFTKLKFKGKGYYIYKNYRNTITHQFGHSHRVYIYAHCVTVKFLSKTTVFLFGSSKRDIFSIGHQVQRSKYINVFTGRGVRFARQVIYKKTGKVSTYR